MNTQPVQLQLAVRGDLATVTQTIIHGLGPYSGCPEASSVEDLLRLLKKQPLKRSFEAFGNFIIQRPLDWKTDEPMYPEGMVLFFGNFLTYSFSFSIVTNDPDLIERLTRGIRANQARRDYLAQAAPAPSCAEAA